MTPRAPVRGQPTAGHNAVDVGVIQKVLPPGVQDTDEADLCAEMPGILAQFPEGLGNRPEQQIIQDPLIHDDQGIELCGDGEDDMEVLNRQEVLSSRLDPPLFLQSLALGAVAVPAGVVGDLDVPAVLAPVCMPAQSSRPADLHGTHDPQVMQRQAVGFPVLRAVPAEDIRHLDAARGPHPAVGR